MTERLFYSLLSSALWQIPIEEDFKDVEAEEWKRILQFSNKQTVTAIIFDVVRSLPAEQQPPLDLLNYWEFLTKGIVKNNKKHRLLLNYITTRLKEEGNIVPILLKGLSIAEYYNSPELRVSGDIDFFYTNVEEYEKANNLISSWGIKVEIGETKESLCHINGVPVENHGELIHFHNIILSRYLDRKFNSFLSRDGSIIDAQICGADCRVLSSEMAVLHLVSHIHKHLLNEGIGLRQLSDIAVFLNANKTKIKADVLVLLLNTFGYYNFANYIFSFCVSELKMPKTSLPYYIDYEKYDFSDLLLEISMTGNLGLQDERYLQRPEDNLGSKMFTAKRALSNIRKFGKYSPWESWSWFIRLFVLRIGQMG